jgi:hypothetical protein
VATFLEPSWVACNAKKLEIGTFESKTKCFIHALLNKCQVQQM